MTSRFDAYIAKVAAEERANGIANAPRKTDNKWCTCEPYPAPDTTSYYAHEDGRHGWFHDPAKGGCGGITQTG